MDNKQKFEDVVKKVDELRKSGNVDLSTEEDLSIAIMNLIGIEEHLFFTGEKIRKPEYFDLLTEVREVRKNLLAKMLDKTEGETWCISKHLLSASYRLMEVGTKLQSQGKKKEAQEMFDNSYKMYSMFWALRLKVITVDEVKENTASEKPWTVEDIVEKLVDCCHE